MILKQNCGLSLAAFPDQLCSLLSDMGSATLASFWTEGFESVCFDCYIEIIEGTSPAVQQAVEGIAEMSLSSWACMAIVVDFIVILWNYHYIARCIWARISQQIYLR